jgi:hypothetical protein
MPAFVTESDEPISMFEVFLPKRMEYQSKLYEALQFGLHLNRVRAFLEGAGADPQAEIDRIRALIPGKAQAAFTPERVARMQQVYFGFSLYEVDGVFVTDPSDPGNQRTQERTQVVRLFFKPDAIIQQIRSNPSLSGTEAARLLHELRSFQESSVSWVDAAAVETYLSQHANPDRPTLRDSLAALEEWRIDVLLFVFGYVVGKITEDLSIDENEIWVTSHQSLVVNVIRRL